MQITPGTKLNHYEIVAPIGQGGMGRVYRARDHRLERDVAIKLLAAQFTKDEHRVSRFIREAKAASALNHPNIITIHEIGESHTEAHLHFIVTELVEGHTLRQMIKKQRLMPATAVEVALQVAGALAAAHKAGIVHRDIKPENVMVRQDGIVKVLDFGLAKLTERQAPDPEAATRHLDTDPGVVMGTAQYMSPEQARGLDVDARSDLFSLGAILYEMIAGRPPFNGATSADVISELLQREPEPLYHHVPALSSEFLLLVNKLLQKDREARYASAQDLLVDLKQLKRQFDTMVSLDDWPNNASSAGRAALSYETTMMPSSSSGGSGEAAEAALTETPTKTLSMQPVSSAEYLLTQIKQHRRAFLTGLGAAALASAGGYYAYRQRTSRLNSIAIMLFEAAPELAAVRDTLVDGVINHLSQHKSLNVKSRGAVETYQDKTASDLARALGVNAILNGRLTQQGETLKVSVALVAARDNRHLWGEQYTRSLDDHALLEQEIAREVAQQLQPALSEADRKKIEAYSLTVRGRNAWNKRNEAGLLEAQRLFEQALQNDDRYAPAYAGLADSYNMLANYSLAAGQEMFAKAQMAAQRALDLDDKLAEAHAARAFTYMQWEWNWQAAEEQFRRAIQLKPNYAPAHQWYSSLLAITGRMDEGLAMAKRAQELDPLSPIVSTHLAWVNFLARRYDEMLRHAQDKLKTNANFFVIHRYLGLAYQAQNKHAEAIEEFQKALAPSRGSIFQKAELAHAYARAGQRAEAQRLLAELQQISSQRFVSSYYFGLIYAGLNDREQALKALNKAFSERAERLVWLGLDPRFDGLRNDPRFRDLLERIGLV